MGSRGSGAGSGALERRKSDSISRLPRVATIPAISSCDLAPLAPSLFLLFEELVWTERSDEATLRLPEDMEVRDEMSNGIETDGGCPEVDGMSNGIEAEDGLEVEVGALNGLCVPRWACWPLAFESISSLMAS